MSTTRRTCTLHPLGDEPNIVKTNASKIRPGFTPVPATETPFWRARESRDLAIESSTINGKAASSADINTLEPELIASRVYGGRMGNGDEASKEGYKFRGRGYIQLTGRDNYTQFGKAIGVDIPSNPDSVATTYALASAAWFFSKNGLHKLADGGSSDAVVTQITKRVNGGTIGLADRIRHFKEYYYLLA